MCQRLALGQTSGARRDMNRRGKPTDGTRARGPQWTGPGSKPGAPAFGLTPSCRRLHTAGCPALASDIRLNQNQQGLGPEHVGTLGYVTGPTSQRAAEVHGQRRGLRRADTTEPLVEGGLDSGPDDLPVRHRRLRTSACRTRWSTPTATGAPPEGGPGPLLKQAGGEGGGLGRAGHPGPPDAHNHAQRHTRGQGKTRGNVRTPL